MTVRTSTPPIKPAAPKPKTARSYYWPGFVVGFALMALASCGGLAMALGLTDLRLVDLDNSQQAWVPPTTAPAAEQVASAGIEESGGAFAGGDTVRNMTGGPVNVRISPGRLGKPAGDIIAQAGPSEEMTILGPRAEQDSLIWWQVNFRGIEGWVAEASPSGVQILGAKE